MSIVARNIKYANYRSWYKLLHFCISLISRVILVYDADSLNKVKVHSHRMWWRVVLRNAHGNTSSMNACDMQLYAATCGIARLFSLHTTHVMCVRYRCWYRSMFSDIDTEPIPAVSADTEYHIPVSVSPYWQLISSYIFIIYEYWCITITTALCKVMYYIDRKSQ